MNLESSRQIFEKYSYIKFSGNLFSGRQVVSFGQPDRRTDMPKLMVAFRKFGKVPKKTKHKENFCNFWSYDRN
jgi:hypothetical protein